MGATRRHAAFLFYFSFSVFNSTRRKQMNLFSFSAFSSNIQRATAAKDAKIFAKREKLGQRWETNTNTHTHTHAQGDGKSLTPSIRVRSLGEGCTIFYASAYAKCYFSFSLSLSISLFLSLCLCPSLVSPSGHARHYFWQFSMHFPLRFRWFSIL